MKTETAANTPKPGRANNAWKNGQQPKLPLLVQLACCWPIGLIVVGGLVGGLCGGAAIAVNMILYNSSLPRWSLWLLNPLVGLAAILLWLIIGIFVQLALGGSATTPASS